MAANPQYATVHLVSQNKGRTKAIDAYCSDVANAQVRFDEGNGAGAATPTKYTIPFNGYIFDFTMEADMTDTNVLQLTIGGAPTGDWMRYKNHLSTAERTALIIPVAKGQELGFIQRA